MRILWLKTELLHPVDKGGRIRTYQMLRWLKEKHHITYLCLDDGGAAPDALERASEYCHVVEYVPFHPPARRSQAFWLDLFVNLFSPLPYAVGKYKSHKFASRVRELCASGAIDLVVCDFLTPSVNVPDNPGIPAVMFQHNVESRIWERHTSVAKNLLKRAYMGEQWRRMKRHEEKECKRFDRVIAVSPQDMQAFREEFGLANVAAVSTGVDTDFFSPSGLLPRNPLELVFTGTMDWMPNEDGILWFAREVLPLIQQRCPGVKLTIVGRNPPPAITRLASDSDVIEVTGAVPDVRPYVERAAVSVVPLRVGGGTRLKIYEAMAMERAVVTTTIGAEGLPLQHNVDCLIADTPSDFASAVCELLENPRKAREIGATAAEIVRLQHSWESVANEFAGICEGVAESPGQSFFSVTTYKQ